MSYVDVVQEWKVWRVWYDYQPRWVEKEYWECDEFAIEQVEECYE